MLKKVDFRPVYHLRKCYTVMVYDRLGSFQNIIQKEKMYKNK